MIEDAISHPSKDQLLALYRQMLLIRRCEEQLVRLYAAGKIVGACHTYIGEEAVATGVCAHLRPDDTVFSTHRGHGHALAKGIPPRELIAELFGKAGGCSGGRGGSMHLFKPEVGFMGSERHRGAGITLAAGAALSAKLLKTDRVSVAFFGDGASEQRLLPRRSQPGRQPGSCRRCSSARTTSMPPRCRSAQASANPHVAVRAQAYGHAGSRG